MEGFCGCISLQCRLCSFVKFVAHFTNLNFGTVLTWIPVDGFFYVLFFCCRPCRTWWWSLFWRPCGCLLCTVLIWCILSPLWHRGCDILIGLCHVWSYRPQNPTLVSLYQQCSSIIRAMDMEIMPLNRAKLNLFKGVFALGDNLIVVKTYYTSYCGISQGLMHIIWLHPTITHEPWHLWA